MSDPFRRIRRREVRARLAAAMHDDDVDPARGEKRDVVGDAIPDRRIGIIHEAAAVFNDESGSAKILNVRQSLEENLRLGGDFGNVH